MNASYRLLCASLLIPLFLAGCDDDSVSPADDTTVADIDGNVYQTVEIQNQVWMAENLKVTRYRDGGAIVTDLDAAAWSATTSGATAIYPHALVDGIDSDAEMVFAYGRLYNWYAVQDPRGLCPAGWRIPSDEEWKTMEMSLGMSREDADNYGWRGNESAKLRSTRTEPDLHPRWISPNTDATNESGFTALPGGFRTEWGTFDRIDQYAYWWTSTSGLSPVAWRRALISHLALVDRNRANRAQGMSIRCISD